MSNEPKPLTSAEIEGYRRTVELVRSGKDDAGSLGYVRDMTHLLATIDALAPERNRLQTQLADVTRDLREVLAACLGKK